MERAVSSSSQEDFETSEPALGSPLSFSRPWALGIEQRVWVWGQATSWLCNSRQDTCLPEASVSAYVKYAQE